MKKNIAIYIMLLLAPLTFLSCDQWGGETVESAYREPQIRPINSNAMVAAV